MKVILTEDINPLGAMGAVVDVARGYARNFLIPQGKAMEATPGNLVQVERAKVKYLQTQATEREKAQAQVAHLEGASVTIAQRVAEEERLYGSVTAAMIAEALESQGFIVDKKQLDLPEPIKKLGTYEVTIRLAPEVQTTVTVVVVADKRLNLINRISGEEVRGFFIFFIFFVYKRPLSPPPNSLGNQAINCPGQNLTR